MKMHPKPMIRHMQHVQPIAMTPRVATDNHPEPYHIQFMHSPFHTGQKGHPTQTLTMTRDEAMELFTTLGVMLRYPGVRAADIDPGTFSGYVSHLKHVASVTSGITFGRASGGDKNLQQIERTEPKPLTEVQKQEARRELKLLEDPTSLCYSDGHFATSLVRKYGMSITDLRKTLNLES